MRLKIYRCFCGKLAQYTVISVYWNKWIKFRIHFSAVFPDCLGAKGSIRRLAPTTELEFRVCWLGLLALEIEINTSATWKAPEARVARLGRFSRCLWQNMRNLINYSWKKCKKFRFFCFLLPRTRWYTHQSDADYMLSNSIENFEAWKIDLHGDMAKKRKTSSEHDKLCQFCVFIAPNHSAASLQLGFAQKHRCWFGARDTSQSGRTAERWIFEKRSNRRRISNYTWIYTIIVGY